MPPTPPRKKNRQRNQLLITLGVMAVLTVGLGIFLVSATTERPPLGEARPAEPPPDQPAPVQQPPAPPSESVAESAPSSATLVDDDGRTLWVSPTDGDAIDLRYLPPGAEFILHLRPAEWLAEPTGRAALDAAGPEVGALVEQLERLTGYKLRNIDELLLAVRGARGDGLETAFVVAPSVPLASDGESFSVPQAFQAARAIEYEGLTYQVGATMCCFVPPAEEGRLFVLAPRSAMQEVLEAGGAAPPMRRELETVAACTDQQRHATLLATPSFLFTEGRGLFAGEAAPLRSAVFEFQPDELRAVSLSAHWGEDFYLEMRGASSADLTATRLAATLDSRVAKWADALQMAVLDLNPAPHGRRLVAKLPAMTRLLAQYTRFGAEDQTAVLNCYLPLRAGENLLAAGELMLAQLSAGAGGQVGTTATTAQRPETIAEKLKRRVSVSFARDTLEMAVQYLSDEIDTPIVILGGDLQLEGITKNQSFGMQAAGEEAEKVLVEILTKANPDKTATGPTDSRQKLVYVVKAADNEETTLYVTTRAAAAKRGDPLPDVFVE